MSTPSQTDRPRAGNPIVARNAVLRNGLLALVSILVLLTDVVLILFVRSVHPPPLLAVLFYLFPAFHLLPWAAGLQALRLLRRAEGNGTIDPNGAKLGYEIVLGLLFATYVVLGAGEQLAISAYAVFTIHATP